MDEDGSYPEGEESGKGEAEGKVVSLPTERLLVIVVEKRHVVIRQAG
jgi:hypothetical protein